MACPQAVPNSHKLYRKLLKEELMALLPALVLLKREEETIVKIRQPLKRRMLTQ
jgi:hypothetical protein